MYRRLAGLGKTLDWQSLRGFERGQHSDEAPSSAFEPCLGCGDETAVGSALFPERHDVRRPNRTRGYLCADCMARIRASGHVVERTSIQTVGEAAMIGMGFAGWR